FNCTILVANGRINFGDRSRNFGASKCVLALRKQCSRPLCLGDCCVLFSKLSEYSCQLNMGLFGVGTSPDLFLSRSFRFFESCSRSRVVLQRFPSKADIVILSP